MKYSTRFYVIVGFLINLSIVACGGGGSGATNPPGSETSASGTGGEPTSSPGSTTSLDPYVGTWKGTTYGGNGTFPDITLTLNKDGSYTCSGYPEFKPDVTDTTWTPWRGICSTPSNMTATWDLPSEKKLRFTHNNSNLQGISITKITSSDATSFILELSSGSISKIFAQFNKQ
jgi:hypothetical protein